MGHLLKPNQHLDKMQRYITKHHTDFVDLGQQQRVENINLEKDDIRFTRRMMELFNKKSIANAAYVTHSLTVKKDAVTRLKKYVGNASPSD